MVVVEIHFIDGPTVILLVSEETHRETSSEELGFRGSKGGMDPLNFASILVSILMLHGQTGCDFSKSSDMTEHNPYPWFMGNQSIMEIIIQNRKLK